MSAREEFEQAAAEVQRIIDEGMRENVDAMRRDLARLVLLTIAVVVIGTAAFICMAT